MWKRCPSRCSPPAPPPPPFPGPIGPGPRGAGRDSCYRSASRAAPPGLLRRRAPPRPARPAPAAHWPAAGGRRPLPPVARRAPARGPGAVRVRGAGRRGNAAGSAGLEAPRGRLGAPCGGVEPLFEGAERCCALPAARRPPGAGSRRLPAASGRSPPASSPFPCPLP